MGARVRGRPVDARRVARRTVAVALVGLFAGALCLSGPTAGAVQMASARSSGASTYANPVFDTDFPDPEVLWTDREYVAVATGTSAQDVQSAVSTDLAGWRRGPDLLPHLPPWALDDSRDVWGPHLERVRHGWLLWFSAEVAATGHECIGWASSPHILGPYVSTATSPALCQDSLGGSIDPTVAVDRNGSRYLLWKSNGNCCALDAQIWSQPLAADGHTLLGEPTAAILGYAGGWEQGPTAHESTVEGPSVLVANGHDFLLYSGGGYLADGYAMGVAQCRSLALPCTPQSTVPSLAATASVAGPGGGSVFRDRYGRPWLAYAAWTPALVGYSAGGARSFRIDRLEVVGDQLYVLGPTTGTQSLRSPARRR